MTRRYRLGRLPGIALAIAIPVGGVMLIVLADVVIRRDVALLIAAAVVIILAWAGGIWAGLIATLLLMVTFAGPFGDEQFNPPQDDLSLFLFAVSGLVGTGVVESLHRARWRVEAARDRARNSRRSEHAARAELESIVAAIGEGIMVSDADGTVSLMNQAAIDLLGRRIDRFDAVAEAFAGDADSPTPAQLLVAEGPSTAEYELVADGRRIELSSFPLLVEGEASRRVLLLRDVTEARRRDRVRDAFLSLLSHELRTPMTAVYGGATLLQRVGDQLDAETRQELRNDIVYEADRLSRLIDDLLVLTRLEGGVEVGHEPALLQHLVSEVVAQDRRSANGTTIEVAMDAGLPPVIGDETGIRQVTHNLISNAVKYSPPASTVEVRVEATDADEVTVRVLDRGPGLADEETAQVFEPFYRGPATERAAPGLGIGLFVCQRLVEAMGGRIWTSPREGGGSEFGFALEVWPIEAEVDESVDASQPVRTGASW
ncbi:MAG TPA: ATP-binding protein [Candidatus Limnocylindria bacterium]